MATRAAKTVPLFTSGHQLDTAIGTAMATRAAKTVPLFTSGRQLDTQSGRQWRPGAEIAQASIGIGVEAAELTRPCSPQESRRRVDDPAPRRCRSPVATVQRAENPEEE